MTEKSFIYFPDAEYRFFIYDPEGSEFQYFKSADERDAAARDVILSYLDDGWSESVDQVIAGEITHHTVMRNVEAAPKREEYSSDEEFEEAKDEFSCGGELDFDYKCTYELAPLEDPGETA